MRDTEDRMLPVAEMKQAVRKFESGATRNLDDSKYDYEAFLSPLVIERYGKYMHSHRMQADGTLRDGDNWQKGIELNSYMKSGYRHFVDWWKHHRNVPAAESLEEALCALIFNAMGYLHEHLTAKLKAGRLAEMMAKKAPWEHEGKEANTLGRAEKTNHSYGYGGSTCDAVEQCGVSDCKADVCKTP